MNYDSIIPDEFNGKKGRKVDFVDVGCGFGGLLCYFLIIIYLIKF